MKKLFSILIIAILTASIFTILTPIVNASESLLVDNGIANWANGSAFPATTLGSGYAYLFSGNNEFLSHVTFWVKNSSNTVSGILMACLYPATITNASIVNSTTTINLADIEWDNVGTAAGYREINFTFDMTTQLNLGANNYWIGLICQTSTSSAVTIGRSGDTQSRSYRSGLAAWTTNANNPALVMIYTESVYGGEEEEETQSLSYTYSISPDPESYGIYSWGRSAMLTQDIGYQFVGQVYSNSTPYVNGVFTVYKTAVFNSSMGGATGLQNAVWALGNDTVTLNETGTLSNNFFLFDFYGEYQYLSVVNYEGFRVNGTLTDNSTFTVDVVMVYLEPDVTFQCSFTGGHLGTAYLTPDPWPNQTTLQQRTTYGVYGFVFFGNVVTGNGNFTLYTGGLSQVYNQYKPLWQYIYIQAGNGTITDGLFNFALASRQSTDDLYEVYRIEITLDTGESLNKTYLLFWSYDALTPGSSNLYPTPSGSTTPGTIDANGLNTLMTYMINIIILLLIVGGPMLILGTKAGLPGLIIGGTFGLGIAVVAGILPSWFIIFFGAGLTTAFLMWRKNNGQG